MLRIISSNVARSVKNAPSKVIATVATRNFFWGKKDDAADNAVPEIKVRIKTDKEHQFGRRKEELDAEEEGMHAFSTTSSIVPPHFAGSWGCPILIPSYMPQRAVGFEDPFTHQMRWFNINRGEVAFIPEINLYFEMADLNDPRNQPRPEAEKILREQEHAIASGLKTDTIAQ